MGWLVQVDDLMPGARLQAAELGMQRGLRIGRATKHLD